VYNVCQLAAVEYCHWRTQRSGGRWTFRLPTDREWERAAKGGDGRPFVWGDDLIVWNFCRSLRGSGQLGSVGAFPFDASVFGVRDMEGSVREYTSDRPQRGFRFVSVRGGSWATLDKFRFRLANRDGVLPDAPRVDNGFRVVAEPFKPSSSHASESGPGRSPSEE
jgi:formylglycine-generating enzyme required for sulfatase activity